MWQRKEFMLSNLEAGAMNGAFLETWVVAEILKSYWHHGLRAPLTRMNGKNGITAIVWTGKIQRKLHAIQFLRKFRFFPFSNVEFKHFPFFELFLECSHFFHFFRRRLVIFPEVGMRRKGLYFTDLFPFSIKVQFC